MDYWLNQALMRIGGAAIQPIVLALIYFLRHYINATDYLNQG